MLHISFFENKYFIQNQFHFLKTYRNGNDFAWNAMHFTISDPIFEIKWREQLYHRRRSPNKKGK